MIKEPSPSPAVAPSAERSSKPNREKRLQWVREGKCFVCGTPVEQQSSAYNNYCLTHSIRLVLRRSGIFFTKAVYRSSNSRVHNERIRKRKLIVALLRARYLAIRDRKLEPITTVREALFFIDSMWTQLALHHAFILRRLRLASLCRIILNLDYTASKGRKGSNRNGWNGPKSNIRTWRDRKANING